MSGEPLSREPWLGPDATLNDECSCKHNRSFHGWGHAECQATGCACKRFQGPPLPAEHIRVAEPAPPVWEYRAASSIEALSAAAADGWRLHTAVPFHSHVQFVLERRRP